MWWFVAGFVVALLAAVLAATWLLCKKSDKIRADKNGHRKQLEQLSKLTGGLAHEIKNPLSTIQINLKLIAEELKDANLTRPGEKGNTASNQSSARALRKIAIIQKETDRLQQILDSFLRYVGRVEPQLASIDVNELVDDMVDFYSPQAQSRSITVRHGLYNGPLVCKIDADMLKQALLNLFINAQQAMGNGGELIIRTDRQKKDAVIRVSDTGVGIAADKLNKVFDAYYSSRPSGSGLGLPTVKRIIEAHNGTIDVNSQLGKGTSFTIKLPLSGVSKHI